MPRIVFLVVTSVVALVSSCALLDAPTVGVHRIGAQRVALERSALTSNELSADSLTIAELRELVRSGANAEFLI